MLRIKLARVMVKMMKGTLAARLFLIGFCGAVSIQGLQIPSLDRISKPRLLPF